MNKEKVIISGINGFVGHHLARELFSQGFAVIGVGNDREIAADIKDVVDEYYPQDLVDNWPDTGDVKSIIHIAGLAAVGPSFENPQQYINVNSAMVTNLCEYYLTTDTKPRVVIVSSGAIYSSNQPMPITEDSSLGLTSPYAVSKVLTENQAVYYRSRGLETVVVRPFNHIGPGQGLGFILPDFYKRLKETSDSTIKVGNITTRRDYTDVRDIVKAYRLLATASNLKDVTYNICSGKSLSGSEILEQLKISLDRSDVTFDIDESLIRPTDAKEIVGSSLRLQNELGWTPEYSITQTIQDFVNQENSKG